MVKSRYIVGIDLGTTNCAVAYVDMETSTEESVDIKLFRIPQLVGPGVVEERDLLPSFLYLPGEHDFPSGSLRLPWAETPPLVVGELAQKRGAEVPGRLLSSAKSWLSHIGVDRTAPILPWGATEEVKKMSPVAVSAQYLLHIKNAWNHAMAADNAAWTLERQDILLTVPASFDPAARDLTMQAAERAGLRDITLLEEPQAAFYSWIEGNGKAWRKQVQVGDIILVCDLGGGTTDFTLIAVSSEEGELVLKRVAVGEHILLGGDNMDLALAYAVQQKLAAQGTKLNAKQLRGLWQQCRAVKESLLQKPKAKSQAVTILGGGSSLIGGSIRTEVTRDDIEAVLIEGFFPFCKSSERPQVSKRVGLQEIGLPYAADPGITRHMAKFLGDHRPEGDNNTFRHPTALLFNGGVTKGDPLRERLITVLNEWLAAEKEKPVRVLTGTHPDLAVARGAAYYGVARRGKGIRIRGGVAQTYYIGIESSMPAVPGMPAPIKALCVVPYGMEEGTEADIPGEEFGLVIGQPAEFRFLGSPIRREDRIGTLVEEWQDDIKELSPLETVLSWEGQEGVTIPVRLHTRVTEIGTLELWCVTRDESRRWKLEFNVRSGPDQQMKG